MRKPAVATLIALAAFVGGGLLAGLLGAWALRIEAPANAKRPAWQETAWPFPMDQWGKGQAFRCNASACGVEVVVYLRAKVGFCNCNAGMADDADLDRVSDFDLLGGALYAQAPGHPVRVAWMKGRSRPYAIRDAQRSDATMLSIGLHDSCDALVATAVVKRGGLALAEPAVFGFLNSQTVAQWAQTALGL